jgi:hypothetical protein
LPSTAPSLRRAAHAAASTIAARRRLYDAAYTGDLDRLRAEHGPGPVLEALQRLEPRSSATSAWDAPGHRRRVARGIRELLQRRAADPDNFDDGVKI